MPAFIGLLPIVKGYPLGFMRFLRIGLPLTMAQLLAATLCILWMVR